MNKTLLAIATAIFAVATLFASAAEAGFKIHFGFGNHHGFHRHHKRHRYVARRHAKPKVYVTKKAKPVYVEAPAEVADAAESENSSIAVASVEINVEPTADVTGNSAVKADKTADAAAKPAKVAESIEAEPTPGPRPSNKLDCKKFFPSVGMTLTVPCE